MQSVFLIIDEKPSMQKAAEMVIKLRSPVTLILQLLGCPVLVSGRGDIYSCDQDDAADSISVTRLLAPSAPHQSLLWPSGLNGLSAHAGALSAHDTAAPPCVRSPFQNPPPGSAGRSARFIGGGNWLCGVEHAPRRGAYRVSTSDWAPEI